MSPYHHHNPTINTKPSQTHHHFKSARALPQNHAQFPPAYLPITCKQQPTPNPLSAAKRNQEEELETEERDRVWKEEAPTQKKKKQKKRSNEMREDWKDEEAILHRRPEPRTNRHYLRRRNKTTVEFRPHQNPRCSSASIDPIGADAPARAP
jgi:hypothetical protein